MMTRSAIGTTNRSKAGATSFRPSTAESTEMAGVITASPKKNAAPAMPSPSSRDALPRATRWPSAIRAKVPPSPSLSARSSTNHVLQRHDERQRPEDEREHPDHRLARDGAPLP